MNFCTKIRSFFIIMKLIWQKQQNYLIISCYKPCVIQKKYLFLQQGTKE